MCVYVWRGVGAMSYGRWLAGDGRSCCNSHRAARLSPTGEAAVRCTEMLHQSLCTLAPRVAFYQLQQPGKALPGCSTLQRGDNAFCQRCKLDPREFAAFKASWLASEEGQAVCQHEGKQSERQRRTSG